MKILANSGYHAISPGQLYDYLVYNKTLPEKPVIIAFDDSSAGHYEIASRLNTGPIRMAFMTTTVQRNSANVYPLFKTRFSCTLTNRSQNDCSGMYIARTAKIDAPDIWKVEKIMVPMDRESSTSTEDFINLPFLFSRFIYEL